VEIAAVPAFMSPFRWTIIAQTSNAYELQEIDLLDVRLRSAQAGEQPGRRTIRYPNVWIPEVLAAAQTGLAQRFLGFSRFPAARSALDDRTGAMTVRWTDMRFVNASPVSRSGGRGGLFTATVRLDPRGNVVDARLGP
jgi:hypothetical protein